MRRLVTVAALVVVTSTGCLVEGRCVVEVVPVSDGKTHVEVKSTSGGESADPKQTSQALKALAHLGESAFNAALAIIF